MHYYQEFCQLTIANMVMQTQIKKLLLERQEMWHRMQKVEARKKEELKTGILQPDAVKPPVQNEPILQNTAPKLVQNQPKIMEMQKSPIIVTDAMILEDMQNRHKRHRRTAGEIERHYRCPGERCGKSYGSEGSLNQHIKIKHPELMPPTPPVIPKPPVLMVTKVENLESSKKEESVKEIAKSEDKKIEEPQLKVPIPTSSQQQVEKNEEKKQN